MGRLITRAARMRPLKATFLAAWALGLFFAALHATGLHTPGPLGPIAWAAVYGLPALAGGLAAWLIASHPPD